MIEKKVRAMNPRQTHRRCAMTKQKERMEERTVVSMDEAIKLLNTTRPTFYR